MRTAIVFVRVAFFSGVTAVTVMLFLLSQPAVVLR